MKNSHFFFIYSIIFFGTCPLLFGQTSNTGMMYISPETEFSTLDHFQNSESGKFYNDGISYFYSHFTNEGIVDYFSEKGKSLFIGSKVQAIKGQGETYFWDLIFNNGFIDTPFELYSDIITSGKVDFSDGIVDNDSYGGSFLFSENSGHSSVSNNSHVDGPVMKKGNTSFEFPIGDGGFYRYAGTSENDWENASYKAKYFFENPDPAYPLLNRPDIIKNINDAEYWQVIPVQEESEIVLTLSWDEATTPEHLLKNPEAIHIVRWDETQQLWLDEGGVVNESNKNVSALVSAYGIFTLATVETGEVLPCQLAVYNAVTPNDDGKNDYFIIDQLNNGGCAEKIAVKIFNRWNVKVFETDNYGQSGNFFNGYSQGRGTVGNERLPTGTYFYIMEFDYSDGEGNTKTFKRQGYLYLNGN